MAKQRIAVITASFGERRGAFYTPAISAAAEYHAYCWRRMTTRTPWVRHILDPSGDPLPLVKQMKFTPWLTLPDFDWYIWIDAQCRLTADPEELVAKLAEADMGLARKRHKCIYREGRICGRKGKADLSRLEAAEQFYRSRGWPEDAGLFYGGCVIQRRCPATEAFSDLMLTRCQDLHFRDQVHIPPALSEAGVKVHTFDSPRRLFREGS